MNELPRQKLRGIVARHGPSVARDRRRAEGLLRDCCGAYPREVSVLVSALEEHVAEDLLAATATTPHGVLLARLARRLSDNLALTEAAAVWAVNSWALALGVVSEDELSALEGQRGAPSDEAHAKTDPTPPLGRLATAGRLAATPVVTTAADVIVVSADGGGDFASIGEALKAAAPGARILVRPGLYEESIVIDKQVEIAGDGPVERIIVRGTAASCVRMLADRARVAGLTLRGVAAGGGEGFFAVDITRGQLLLEDCDISSETLSCVAVHGDTSAPTLRRCRIHDGADSGVYFFDGAAGALEDCEVYENANVGVAITDRASPSLTRTKIYGGENAGVVVWDGGVGTLDECEVYGNRLAGVGVSAGGRLTARACRIHEGVNSGVFVHDGGDATLEACDIFGHREAEVAVQERGQLTALRCEIHRGRGPGVFVRDGGQALVEECEVRDNAGHGVVIGDGSLAAVIRCRVKGNGKAGVKIAGGGAARVSGSDLSGNALGPWDVEEDAHLEGDNVE